MFSFLTTFLEPIAILLYFVSLVLFKRQGEARLFRPLYTYYFVATGLQILAAILHKVYHVSSNIWVYDLLGVVTTVFIGIYFYRLLQTQFKKKMVLVLLSIHLIYVVTREFMLAEMRLFDSIGYAMISASIVIYVFMYFSQLLGRVTTKNILKEFHFWLASGYLFYYLGSFLIFVSYYYFTLKYLKNPTGELKDLLTALWGLHNVLLFISALSLLTFCLWMRYRRKLA